MLLSAVLFAALLCLKHIYLYLAPAYFVYLLRNYCLNQKSLLHIRYWNCLKLALGLTGIFGIAFGPFIYWGQLDQVLARLFPFSRGLCHAYWAPNIWAMYSFSDRVLIHGLSFKNFIASGNFSSVSVAPTFGLKVDQGAVNSLTRGFVGDTSFAVLPDISPKVTFILTIIFQLVTNILFKYSLIQLTHRSRAL